MSIDSTVTARVPKEIRTQGEAALKRIDSTVTELINSAFEYVIKAEELPTASSTIKRGSSGKKIVRTFTPEQKARFSAYVKATSLPLDSKYATLTAKDIKALRLSEKYGA